jgi:hypothetical protein
MNWKLTWDHVSFQRVENHVPVQITSIYPNLTPNPFIPGWQEQLPQELCWEGCKKDLIYPV